MTRQWLSVDLKTGGVLADLPSLDVEWPLRRSLSNVETATAHLYLAGAPRNWRRAAMEGAAVLACYDDVTLPDGSTPKAIEWAGYVSGADINETDIVDLSAVTAEGYLERRYAEDITYTCDPDYVGEAPVVVVDGWQDVAADLVTRWVVDGSEPGLDLLTVVQGGTGAAFDGPIIMQNTDNATILTRLNELVGRFGGEFAVEWAWTADRKHLKPTLYVGDRIGQAATRSSPAVTFEVPGVITSVRQRRDYSDGQGANKIVAFSSGEGSVTPYAAPVYAADFEGRPTFEYRFSPQQSEPDTAVLGRFAAQAMKILGPGARPVTVTIAAADEKAMRGRRLGVDWRLGDDVGYVIGGVGQDGKDLLAGWPGGISGVGRVIGYEFDETTYSPVFAQPEIYGG